MLREKVLGSVVGLSLFASAALSYGYDVGPFYGGVNTAIVEAMPKPFKEGYNAATGFLGGLLPHPNVSEEVLQDLQLMQQQLSVIEQQLAKVLQLDEITIALLVQDDADTNLTALHNIIDDNSESNGILFSSGIYTIKNMYKTFYSSSGDAKAIFPINGDYYSYAKTLCDNSKGCTETGSTGQRAINLLTQETKQGTLNNLLNDYQNSLTKSSSTWSSLNRAYTTYLTGTDKVLSDINVDYVAKYIKATVPIVNLEIQYYQALMMLYNMQALQLAFYYVSPDLMKGSNAFAKTVNNLDILSAKTGKDGYEEAMQNLTQAYVYNFLSANGSYVIMNIFGGRYVIESDGKFDLDPDYVLTSGIPLSKLVSMNEYIASAIANDTLQLFSMNANTGGADSKSLFKESGSGLISQDYKPATAFLNNCQIINARFPAVQTATVTSLQFICNVEQDGQAYTTSVLKVSVPYSTTLNDNKVTFSVGMNNLDLAYDSSLKHYYIIPNNSADNNFFVSNNMQNPAKSLFDITFDGYGELYNVAYVWDCHGGSAGQCHIAYSPTKVSFLNMVQFAYLPPDTSSRQSCVMSSQSYNGSSCLKQSFGLNGYTGYGYMDVYSHNHSSPASNAYVYALTLNGDVMTIKMYFPLATGRNKIGDQQKSDNAIQNQAIVPACLVGDSTCFNQYPTKDGTVPSEAINFDYAGKGSTVGSNVVIAIEPIDKTPVTDIDTVGMYNYGAYQFSASVLPGYVFAKSDDYQQWLDNIAKGNSFFGDAVSSTYGLNLTFMTSMKQSDQVIVILQSDHGQYRLIYTGNNENTGDSSAKAKAYSLVVQKKEGGSWSFFYDAFDYDKKPSSEILPGESLSPQDVAGVSFENGSLTTYYYDYDWMPNSKTEQSPYQVINSVALEYKAHGYQWIPDPYAKLILQDDGNLAIYSSNASNITGNELGILTHGAQSLWAANWHQHVQKGDNVWEKVQNPNAPILLP